MSESSALQPPRRPHHVADEGFSLALKVSFALHALAACLLFVKGAIFPGDVKPYVPSLRVDMVDLPDQLKKDLQNGPKAQSQASKDLAEALAKAESDAKRIKPIQLPPKGKPPVEKAAPDELVLKPKRVAADTPSPKAKADARAKQERDLKLKGALARIKALSQIAPSADESPHSVLIKGNKLSKGTSISGDARESAVADYYGQVHDRLLENWSLPIWLSRQSLSAQVQLYIDSRGKVRSLRFVKPSGNEQFDSAVRKAVEESQPFPRPPEDIAASLVADGVRLGFPL